MTDQTYQQVVTEYTTQLRGMFAATPGRPTLDAKRGGAAVDAGVLAARAGELAGTSRQLGDLTSAYLDADSQAVREAAEYKLLAQANAEMAVADALLEALKSEATPQKGGAKRSADLAEAAFAVNDLAKLLDESPLEDGIRPFVTKGAVRAAHPTDPAEARAELEKQVQLSFKDIARQSSKIGSQALDSLFQLDAGLLAKAVAPISKEISSVVEKAVDGLNEKIKQLMTNVARLILQAYDWVLAVIGKDTEQAARKQVQGWIEELRSSHTQTGDEPTLADKLVTQVYATVQIEAELTGWITKWQADAQAANQISDAVEALSNGFEARMQRVTSFLKVLAGLRETAATAIGVLIKFVPAFGAQLATLLPVIELIRGAAIMGLLGYTLYTGYDHVDSGDAVFFARFQVHIPDRVTGVRKTVQTALAIA